MRLPGAGFWSDPLTVRLCEEFALGSCCWVLPLPPGGGGWTPKALLLPGAVFWSAAGAEAPVIPNGAPAPLNESPADRRGGAAGTCDWSPFWATPLSVCR